MADVMMGIFLSLGILSGGLGYIMVPMTFVFDDKSTVRIAFGSLIVSVLSLVVFVCIGVKTGLFQ